MTPLMKFHKISNSYKVFHKSVDVSNYPYKFNQNCKFVDNFSGDYIKLMTHVLEYIKKVYRLMEHLV